MTREYRHVVENFDLSYKEAEILNGAEKLLQEMHDDLTMTTCDEDLFEAINNALNALKICNPRLNVEVSLKCKEEEEL